MNVRKHFRKKLQFRLSVLTEAGTPVAAEGCEISAGGLGFVSTTQFKEGDRVRLQFTLPDEQRALDLTAQVRHVIALPNQGKIKRWRMGVKFSALADAEASYLANYIGTTFLMY